MTRLWAGWRMAYIRQSSETADQESSESMSQKSSESMSQKSSESMSQKSSESMSQKSNCLFCGLASQEPSSENLVLERYKHGLLVLNAFPYTSGHVMVAPYRHHDSILGEGEERADLLAAVDRVRHALSEEYKAQGFNIGVNLGRAAGAGVIGHLHWHVVPRWQGDTNFIAAVATTRVMPEALPDTYSRLIGALEKAPTNGLEIEGRGDGS